MAKSSNSNSLIAWVKAHWLLTVLVVAIILLVGATIEKYQHDHTFVPYDPKAQEQNP